MCEARVSRWADTIKTEAAAVELPGAVVAAIITRETAALDQYCTPPPTGQLGDGGHGCGPMQVDDRSWPTWCGQWKAGQLQVVDGIHMGCFVLAAKVKAIARILPQMPDDMKLRAAVAAYNCGEGNVRRAYMASADLDKYTANGNYSADVMERAAYYATRGF
jgi:hypothetical protein